MNMNRVSENEGLRNRGIESEHFPKNSFKLERNETLLHEVAFWSDEVSSNTVYCYKK